MHGYVVATTCSPRNFKYVKAAGATHVFDYRDPEVASKITSVLPTLRHVFDTIGSVDSSSTAASALNENRGSLCTVRPGRANTQDVTKTVEVSDVFVFTAFPTPHSYRGTAHWPVSVYSEFGPLHLRYHDSVHFIIVTNNDVILVDDGKSSLKCRAVQRTSKVTFRRLDQASYGQDTRKALPGDSFGGYGAQPIRKSLC